MSTKGYSAVPTDEPRESMDERERDTTSDGQPNDADPEDDPEEEPSFSERLLPFSSHDDGESQSKEESIHQRATRWVRTQSRRFILMSRAFKKHHSTRSIVLAAIFGCLLASTIGLAISTGILARSLMAERRWRLYPWMRPTRLPWFWHCGISTNNFNLPLSQLYPPLSRDADETCVLAWSQMRHLRCHEKILNRAWDNGEQQSLFEPRYDLYAIAIGNIECISHLEYTSQVLSSQCTKKDTFDTSEYVGPMTADPRLESGPVVAVETLLHRARHTARRSTTPSESGQPPYCVAELYQDWYLVDGMNSGNLNGLDAFLKLTASPSTDDHLYDYYDYAEDASDGAYVPVRDKYRPGIKKGPNDGDTECSWCLLNWFDRKLQSWEEGKILDPTDSTVVSLPTYLRTIEHAGRRCQTRDWNRIFRKNIWMYQEKGWLPEDWESDRSTASNAYPGQIGGGLQHVQS